MNFLDQLDRCKRRFGPKEAARAERLLATTGRRRFKNADELIRLHETLLFLRAYPHSPEVFRRAEELLSTFADRVASLRKAGADLSNFERSEISGIAGTSFTVILGFEVVRCLARLCPNEVEIDWKRYEISDRLAGVWRRLFPFSEEDSMVEAHVPYIEWLRAAMGPQERTLGWLAGRFEELPLSAKEKEELYNSLELPIRFEPADSAWTRTRMRRPVRRVFCHEAPLVRRSDVSLAAELETPPAPLEQLSRDEGRELLDMARVTSAMRFRELHGFTYGDPEHVYRAGIGRGVEVFLSGVPPERRLPLRAYHAAMFFKNGVPIGYFETLTLFERLEVGFNLYYTFREGETAWLFARVLRLFRQVLGVTCFSVDPYQLGEGNDEAIESGAFWFYRKLGFRPVRPEVARLAEREERKIRANPAYRTPPRTLRRLAAGHMIYEIPGTAGGDWDRFHIRNIGLAVQRRMAERHKGSALRMRDASMKAVASALGIKPDPLLEDLAPVLVLFPELTRWTDAEKAALVEILRAKGGPEESDFVRLAQAHRRFREAILRLGRRDSA